MQISAKKGLDSPIAGTPGTEIKDGRLVRSIAVLGRDYIGLKPRMQVQQGDRVTLGQPLFVDKRDPNVKFTAPGSGTVSAVHRGERRMLLSVVIDLDSDEKDDGSFTKLANADVTVLPLQEIKQALFDSGFWTAFRTRPYSKIPQSDTAPRSIFVTATDTQPLAADPSVVVEAQGGAFTNGLRIIGRLTEGSGYVCTDANWNWPTGDGEQFKHVEFTGPHPAGLPGTHIHHLDPVSNVRMVWQIGYQDVIAIGKLFAEGKIFIERVVALGGAGFESPRLVRTRLGASIDELTAGELQLTGLKGDAPRLISGSILSGRTGTGAEAYLGRYHLQVCAIPEVSGKRLFGWLGILSKAFSIAGLFKRRTRHSKLLPFSTSRNGQATAMIPIDAFDHVMPLDILTIPLLRALLVKDTDQGQALGCLELDADDLALCSFVCPGKNDYGSILQVNLEQIEREG